VIDHDAEAARIRAELRKRQTIRISGCYVENWGPGFVFRDNIVTIETNPSSPSSPPR
jgi:hypothetical protein